LKIIKLEKTETSICDGEGIVGVGELFILVRTVVLACPLWKADIAVADMYSVEEGIFDIQHSENRVGTGILNTVTF
jgi:hypothetical protein